MDRNFQHVNNMSQHNNNHHHNHQQQQNGLMLGVSYNNESNVACSSSNQSQIQMQRQNNTNTIGELNIRNNIFV